jgi:hypothetical protein
MLASVIYNLNLSVQSLFLIFMDILQGLHIVLCIVYFIVVFYILYAEIE